MAGHDTLTNNDDPEVSGFRRWARTSARCLNFGARYYRPAIYRWISPDWSATVEPVPYANLDNPQTLNLYAMVRDNPESMPDLDGHASGLLAFAGSLVLAQLPRPGARFWVS